MNPFFRYYGGKWRLSAHVPAPQHGTIVEPFAGAAGYSTRYGAGKRVLLFDTSPRVAALWRFILAPDAADAIAAIPDDAGVHGDIRELDLTDAQRTFLQTWLTPQGSPTNYRMTPGSRKVRAQSPGSFWSRETKRRILGQLPGVRHWEFHALPYHAADTSGPCTWHVDPPYQQNAGAAVYYKGGAVDYAQLAAWCRTLRGQVMVHEQAGATWLPFRTLDAASVCGRIDNGKRAHEVWWTGDAAPRCPLPSLRRALAGLR